LVELRLGRRLTRLEGGNRGSKAPADAAARCYGDLRIVAVCVGLEWTRLSMPMLARRQSLELTASGCTAFMTQMDATEGPERGDEQHEPAGGTRLR
jgi:hypothetical protein